MGVGCAGWVVSRVVVCAGRWPRVGLGRWCGRWGVRGSLIVARSRGRMRCLIGVSRAARSRTRLASQKRRSRGCWLVARPGGVGGCRGGGRGGGGTGGGGAATPGGGPRGGAGGGG